MVLRNYHNILAALVLGAKSTGELSFGDGCLSIKTPSGTLYYLDHSIVSVYSCYESIGKPTGSMNTNSSGSATFSSMVFGTGDTAVTYDDYKLESEYTSYSRASFVVTEPVYDASTRKFTRTVSCVLTNTGASEVTLKEMGIYMSTAGYSSSTTGARWCLVYREVLDTPITIAAGDSVKYTHTFEYTMPTIE